MKYYLAAYTASPNGFAWSDPQKECAYYERLKRNPHIRGLEHPFVENLHLNDDDWFLANIDPSWDFVFTCIPGVMMHLASDPQFGLASDDEGGRTRALEFYRKALIAIEKLNRHCGRQAVEAIEVYSSPAVKGGESEVRRSRASFEKSMSELLSWNWQGASVLVEHCDHFVEGQTAAKGFLSLDDEIETLAALKAKDRFADCGILINWGRSAIEGRSAKTALDHLKTVQEPGLLKGLIFSGCSDVDCDWGKWEDSHMPPVLEGIESTKTSILSRSEIEKVLSVLDPDAEIALGLKISIRDPRLVAKHEDDLEIIAGVLDQGIGLLDESRTAVKLMTGRIDAL